MGRAPRKRRDGEATADDRRDSANDSGQIELNLTFKAADKFKRNIERLNQQMADLKMELASEYKAFEEAGGDRAEMKRIVKLTKQDISKTKMQLEHRARYEDWFLKPLFDAATEAEAEAAGA